MELLPHNKKAVEQVLDKFRASNRAAVVHATGTGKAYIMSAVASWFKHPLIIAPNNFVLDEARKVNGTHAEYMTYQALSFMMDIPTDYDFIGLDEFHRAGAEHWGYWINQLLEVNPDAKVLGTSATHIRYLDGQRNMADELFDGNVVSMLSVKDAIDQQILPNPVYVSALYQIEDSITHTKQCINDNDIYTPEEKKLKLAQLRTIKKSWDQSNGVGGIISKYYHTGMKRVLVFCSSVKDVDEVKSLLRKWFKATPYKSIRFYSFNYAESDLDERMAEFQRDDFDGIKLAISINMLNEGVHVPNVDGIIMLRSTISRIIIEQQVGRCLSVNNNGIRPVVLDLVNNMDVVSKDFSTTFAREAVESVGYNKKPTKDDNKEDETFPFDVVDECREFREFYEIIEGEYTCDPKWFKDVLPQLEEFYAKHHRLPTRMENKPVAALLTAMRLSPYYDRYTWRKEWLLAHGWNPDTAHSCYEEDLQIAENFYNTRGYRPQKNKDQEFHAYARIRDAYSRDSQNLTQEQRKRFEVLRDAPNDFWWYTYTKPILEKYYDEHKRFPTREENSKVWSAVRYIKQRADRYPHRIKWLRERL